jgi:hypothetical protein
MMRQTDKQTGKNKNYISFRKIGTPASATNWSSKP